MPDERWSMFGEINIIILEKWIHKKSSQIDKQKGHKKNQLISLQIKTDRQHKKVQFKQYLLSLVSAYRQKQV